MRVTMLGVIIKQIVAVAVLAAAGGLVAPAAQAAASTATTVCDGHHSPTGVVSGDVVVPYNASCTLTDVTVHGTVIAGAKAFLTVGSGAHIDGDVADGLHGVLTLLDATVDGDVTVDYVNDLGVADSTVGGSLVGTFNKDLDVPECDFGVSGSTIRGDLDITASGVYREVCIYDVTIGRDLRIADAALDMQVGTVGGNVVLTAPHAFHDIKFVNHGYVRSSICSFTVAGDLTLQGSFSSVVLGNGICHPGRLDIHGSLLIYDNQGQVEVSAHVHGDIGCRGNARDPIAGHPGSRHLQNIVEGFLLGQCSTLAVRGP